MPGCLKRTTQRRVTRRTDDDQRQCDEWATETKRKDEMKFLGTWSEEEGKWEI